jgi:SAM-dependent methyltransferase
MTSDIRDIVKEKYGQVAASGLTNDDAGVRRVAEAFGYSADELGAIPAGANMGLSCGNPTALASLRPGETVVDLGSGGGLDVFLAAKAVGPAGRAVGIDMTPEMIDRASRNAREGGYDNVEFHLASIDRIPLPDASADCVISNCVINLAPDKPAVFREMFRVLRPGGRVAVSDIALKRPLPPDLAADVSAYVGCVAGAILIDDYTRGLREAGFDPVHVVDAGADLNAYAAVEGQTACCSPPMNRPAGDTARTSLTIGASACCGSSSEQSPDARAALSCCTPAPSEAGTSATIHGGLATLIEKHDVNDYAASVKVYAVKPA